MQWQRVYAAVATAMQWLREFAAAAMHLIIFSFTAAIQILVRIKSPVDSSGSLAAGDGSAAKGSSAAISSFVAVGGSAANATD